MHKIDKNRLPDITIKETGETYRYNGEKTPLEQVLEAVKGLETAKDGVFLVGQGGVGKSQMLFDYWLMHIADGNCFYVDIKMLDGRKHETAIREYLYDNYRIEINKLSINCMLLLDGINESPYALRKEHDSSSYLSREITALLESKKIRLILCGRSEKITESNSATLARELSDFRFVHCVACKLRDAQVNSALYFDNVLPNVLKNNQMLTMYIQLKEEGMALDNSNLSTCSILNDYMEEYMVKKYRRIICEHEDEDLSERQKERVEDDLFEIYRVLTANAFYATFPSTNIGDYADIVENLGIVIHVEDKYIWSDEIYRCYFLSAILGKAWQFFVETFDILDNSKKASESERIKCAECFGMAIRGTELFINQFVHELDSGNSSWQLLYDTIQVVGEFLLFEEKNVFEWLICHNMVCQRGDNGDETAVEAFIIFQNILYYLMVQNYGDHFVHPRKFQPYIGVFGSCSSLERLHIHNSVECIGEFAFCGCSNLRQIQLGKCLSKIEKQAFYYCTSIENIVIPSNVNIIGEAAFGICSELKNIILENGIKNIEMCAFYKCKRLNAIFIPTSVQKMGPGVFLHCQSLTDIYCEVKSKPKDWDENWICCDATIHWGVSREEYERLCSTK